MLGLRPSSVVVIKEPEKQMINVAPAGNRMLGITVSVVCKW